MPNKLLYILRGIAEGYWGRFTLYEWCATSTTSHFVVLGIR